MDDVLCVKRMGHFTTSIICGFLRVEVLSFSITPIVLLVWDVRNTLLKNKRDRTE